MNIEELKKELQSLGDEIQKLHDSIDAFEIKLLTDYRNLQNSRLNNSGIPSKDKGGFYDKN